MNFGGKEIGELSKKKRTTVLVITFLILAVLVIGIATCGVGEKH